MQKTNCPNEAEAFVGQSQEEEVHFTAHVHQELPQQVSPSGDTASSDSDSTMSEASSASPSSGQEWKTVSSTRCQRKAPPHIPPQAFWDYVLACCPKLSNCSTVTESSLRQLLRKQPRSARQQSKFRQHGWADPRCWNPRLYRLFDVAISSDQQGRQRHADKLLCAPEFSLLLKATYSEAGVTGYVPMCCLENYYTPRLDWRQPDRDHDA